MTSVVSSPDPRIERSRRAALDAAFALLGEVGYGGLTIEAVAARSGVAKSTIYRHWTGKVDLVEAAMRAFKPAIATPVAGPVRDRLVELLEGLASFVRTSQWSSCLPALIEAAERDPEARQLHRRISVERRQVLEQVLRDGVASGELRPDVDIELLAECLVGPVFMRRLFAHRPLDPAQVPALVDQVLVGAGAPGRRHR